jgi:hypothetical protein
MDFGQLRTLNIAGIHDRARSLTGMSRSADSHGGQVDGHRSRLPGSWNGADADTAVRTLRGHVENLDEVRDKLQGAAKAATRLADALGPAKAKAMRGADIAKSLPGADFDTAKGRVDYRWREDLWGPLAKASAQARTNHQKNLRLAKRANELMAEGVKDATTADRETSSALSDFGTPSTLGAPPTPDVSRLTPPANPKDPEHSAAQVHDWWTNLSPRQRQELLRLHPERIAQVDGIPALARDEANRAVLTSRLDANEAELNQVVPQLYENPFDPVLRSRGDQLAKENKRLKALQAEINRPDRFLLGFDTAGDGRVVISLGDPDTASNVVTQVPGVSNDFDNSLDHSDSTSLISRAEAMRPNANTASIMWLGYDTPGNALDAAGGDTRYNTDGSAERLASFTNGLRATHLGGFNSTLVAHSFGGVTSAHAASKYNMNLDNFVQVASVGAGPGVNSVNDYKGVGHSWTMRGLTDIVNVTPFPEDGQDPEKLDGMRVLPGGTSGHSGYWEKGSETLDRINAVVQGQNPQWMEPFDPPPYNGP